MRRRPTGLLAVLILLSTSFSLPGLINAGVCLGIVDCKNIPPGNNFCQQGQSVADGGLPSVPVTPLRVTHPPGYNREGGTLVVKVCVSPGDSDLIGPARRVVASMYPESVDRYQS
jgi:hypothetical protein